MTETSGRSPERKCPDYFCKSASYKLLKFYRSNDVTHQTRITKERKIRIDAETMKNKIISYRMRMRKNAFDHDVADGTVDATRGKATDTSYRHGAKPPVSAVIVSATRRDFRPRYGSTPDKKKIVPRFARNPRFLNTISTVVVGKRSLALGRGIARPYNRIDLCGISRQNKH